MTREELDAYLAQKEQEKGLRPGEFRALWQQESGRSIDPNLRGVYMPKHRTGASGPFQVMPNLHPQFPVGGPLKDQADYAIQFYAGGGGTPEQRLRRYYGTGVAPKGFPSTDQYVAQTMGRMGQQQPLQPAQQQQQQQEQEMASPNYQGSPYEPQYMQVPEPMNYDDLPQPPVRREPTGVEKWLSNPLVHMGAAIMAASGSPLGAPIGYGVASAASGLGEAQKAENDLYELQMKRAQQKRQLMTEDRNSRAQAMEWNQKQAGMAQLMTLADQYEQKGDPLTAAKLRAGIKDGLAPETFHATKTFMDPETGRPVTVMTGTQGTVKKLDNMGVPIAYDEETARKLAYNKGEGGESGQQGVKTLTGLYEGASAAATGLRAVEDMKTLLDRGMFTGRGDELSKELAGWYSWATGKPIPKLSATEQYRLTVQDVVLPALSNMKGASSDRDVAMLKEYAQGTGMTEEALRGALDRVSSKYGGEIDRFNRAYSQFTEGGSKKIIGFEPMERPRGYLARPDSKPAQAASPAAAQPAGPPPSQVGGGGSGTPARKRYNPATGRLE